MGGGVVGELGGDFRLPAEGLADAVEGDAGVEAGDAHLAAGEVVEREVGDDALRAGAAHSEALPASPGPARCPGLVTKSIFAGKLFLDCAAMHRTRRALIAISQAPPLPGRRTFGCA